METWLAILDDDVNSLRIIDEMITSLDGQIKKNLFADKNKFSDFVKENGDGITAVIMDIELGKSSGVELASSLVHDFPNLPVVFITGYPEKYCQDIFLKDAELTPLAFLAKPLVKDNVAKTIEKIRVKSKKQLTTFTANIGKKAVMIKTDDILYIESDNKTVTVYTKNEKFILREKLKDTADRLPENFISPHKSYLVNADYIGEYTASTVKLTDGTDIPVSRSRKNDFVDKLLRLKGFGHGY